MARTLFTQGDHRGQRGWGFLTGDGHLPAAGLIGQIVNIGTKDGLVYDTCTVTAFDSRQGVLTVTGGRTGSPWAGGEPTPLGGEDQVQLWDIACGYIHVRPSVATLNQPPPPAPRPADPPRRLQPGPEQFYLGRLKTGDLVPTQSLTFYDDVQRAARGIRKKGWPGPPLAVSYTHARGQEGNPRIYLNNGHHRWRAAQQEGLDEVPAVTRSRYGMPPGEHQEISREQFERDYGHEFPYSIDFVPGQDRPRDPEPEM